MADNMGYEKIKELREVLQAFSNGLGRESHVLTKHPDLLWQQLYNRLQWEGDEISHILEPEFKARCSLGSNPWLKLRNAPSESGALVRTLEGPYGEVMGCAISPDGSWAASIHYKHLVIWELATGMVMATFKHSSGLEKLCAISPQGNWILTSEYTSILIIDATTGSNILQFETRINLDGRIDQKVNSCAISPDGSWITTANKNQPFFRRWDASTGEELAKFEGPGGIVRISPDGRSILHAHGPNLSVWDVFSGKEKLMITAHFHPFRNYYVTACGISPDGNWIASAGGDRTIKIWDFTSGKQLMEFEGHSGKVRAMVYSPDGKYLVSAGEDQTLKIWDPKTGTEINALVGHTGEVIDCALRPENTSLLSASSDGTLKLWNIKRYSKKGGSWPA